MPSEPVAIHRTDVPARLDRLPWSTFHRRVAIALGITWVLDGLEVTLAGTLAGALAQSPVLHLDAAEVGLAASAYLAGAVGGSILFGHLADRLGRKRLYTATLLVYLVGTAGSALSWSFASYAFWRLITGAGIGGEYSAINSAIQEFTPPSLRGRIDLIINGSFWLGALIGGAVAGVLLAPDRLPLDLGWRLAFGIGAVLGGGVLWLRRYVPESPRWLITHGQPREAERIVREIETEIGVAESAAPAPTLALRSAGETSLASIARALLTQYRRRALLGTVLMAAQAFCYNAIFFTYALVLTDFYGVPAEQAGWYLFPIALGNFAGPLLLGRLFDTVGRKPMIAGTYVLAGILLAMTGLLFREGVLDASTQAAAWSVTFFVASAAASAAYLTIGESFPLEARALAIALFYALGTCLGGIAGPALFGALLASGSRNGVAMGYLLGAILMVAAGAVEWAIGVPAEGRSLESIATPLGAHTDHMGSA
ncbi:MAG TPA: MFS transporter [Stellaceae bacterium]|nr:MFS transporter [Stellaceae bacterium]